MRWAYKRGASLTDASGRVYGSTGVVLDVTGLRAAGRNDAERLQPLDALNRIADLTLLAHAIGKSEGLSYLTVLVERVLTEVARRFIELDPAGRKHGSGDIGREEAG